MLVEYLQCLLCRRQTRLSECYFSFNLCSAVLAPAVCLNPLPASLHVNILYIKDEFHLFSEFSNCQCERSTHAQTHAWRLHARQQLLSKFDLIFLNDLFGANLHTRRNAENIQDDTWGFLCLTHWPPAFFLMIYSYSPSNLSEVCSIYDLAHITSTPANSAFFFFLP